MKTSAALSYGLLPMLLTALAGCTGRADETAPMAFPPPPVTTVTVRARDLPVEREYLGRTQGSREVEIRPRVGGIIEQRLYAEGSRVEAGALLFRLDPKPFEVQVAAAEAELARAKARVAQAERELNRLKPLEKQRVASRKDMDDARSDYDLAAAAVKAAEAGLREARLQLGYTRVTAPIAGFAGLAEKVEGALVSAGADRLTVLTQTDPMDVYFAISENELLDRQRALAEGSLRSPADTELDVKVRLADGRVLERGGHLNFNDARMDPDTGTVTLRARLPNPDGLLKSGQFVRVIVSGAVHPGALTVPQKAVLEGPQGKFVYVVGAGGDGGPVAELRPVRVGEWVGQGDAERNWVIREGLAAGDRVIVDNLIKLGPGAPVQPAPATAATVEPGRPQG